MTTTEMTILPPADDGFAYVPTETTRVVGQFLKYVKGGWSVSNETTRLNGIQLVAYNAVCCWQKWYDQRIVASIFDQPGQLFPTNAAQCDDIDDGPGEWQEGRYLYLSNPENAEEFTYGTSSAGGIQAVDGLTQQINRFRTRGKPGAFPVVELATTSYFHKKHGTMVDKPVLHVRRWVDIHGQPYPMTPITAAVPLAKRIAGSDIRPKTESGDETEQWINQQRSSDRRPPVNDLDADIPY
jgi:hypothetical protein